MKWLWLALFTHPLVLAAAEVGPVPAAVREKFQLAPFYEKCAMVGDFPIVSSAAVADAALAEARQIVGGMLAGRKDLLAALADERVRLAVMATAERTCDIPEHATLTPERYWNRRARGLGATKSRPAVSCGEENLLSCPGDPYSTENILVHEFAHAIHEMALARTDPTFDARLASAYQAAMAAGKWKGCYAAENRQEYWAEAVQSWFGTNRENDAIHNHVNTRAELREYDPAVAKLCEEVFSKSRWAYRRADDPARAGEPHLRRLDRGKLPVFAWSPEETEAAAE